MSPLDILLGKVDVAPAQPVEAPSQNPSGSQPFGKIFAQLFNSIQLNPQDLSKLTNPVLGPENLAAPGAENAVSDFLQALFQALDGGQGLTDEVENLLAKLGIQISDQGLELAQGANPDQLSELLNYLGLGLQEQNGTWVIVKDGQSVSAEQFLGILDEKRQSMAVQQEASRQASYENATMDLKAPTLPTETPAESAAKGAGATQNPAAQPGQTQQTLKDAAIPLPEQDAAADQKNPQTQADPQSAAVVLSGEDETSESADELEAIKNEALKIAAQAKNAKGGPVAVPEAPKSQPANATAPGIEAKPPLIDLSSKAAPEGKGAEGTSGVSMAEGDERAFAAAGTSPKAATAKVDPAIKGLDWNPVLDASAAKGSSEARSDVGGNFLNQGNGWSGMHQAVLTQQGATAEAGRSGDQTFTPSTDLGRDILHQIVDKARVQIGRKETRIEIQLKPEFLGKLRIEVGSKQGELSVAIFTENSAVKNVLESNLQALKDTFAQQGLRLENLQVTVDQQDLAQTASNPNGMAGEMTGGHDSGDEREGGRRNYHETLDMPGAPDAGFNRVLLDLGRVDLFA